MHGHVQRRRGQPDAGTDNTGGNTGDATKVFVAGSIAWTKEDNAGTLQGGATFEVCRTHNLDTSTTGPFVDITPDVCVDVVDDVDGVAGGPWTRTRIRVSSRSAAWSSAATRSRRPWHRRASSPIRTR